MVESKDDGAWFAPHRYGFGAGMPIAWQGWLMLLLQCVVAGWGVVHFAGNENAQLTVVLSAIFVPLPLMIAKTRGGWKWRWGSED